MFALPLLNASSLLLQLFKVDTTRITYDVKNATFIIDRSDITTSQKTGVKLRLYCVRYTNEVTKCP